VRCRGIVILIFIIANQDRRVVSTEEGQELASKYNVSFFETSAKLNIQVDEVFQRVTELVYDKIENNLIDLTNEVGECCRLYHIRYRITASKSEEVLPIRASRRRTRVRRRAHAAERFDL
jgi:GTPase SAR1 family protein